MYRCSYEQIMPPNLSVKTLYPQLHSIYNNSTSTLLVGETPQCCSFYEKPGPPASSHRKKTVGYLKKSSACSAISKRSHSSVGERAWSRVLSRIGVRCFLPTLAVQFRMQWLCLTFC